ncbi:unnamed protein product [Lupinus luteus]|uniref:Uncharacterized protein n=1 Tax=Lupinus luteus TaxID=3873 RepID=A0AAV1Y1H8_LUPLU
MGYDSLLQKETDEHVKIAPESKMVGVIDKETNNHDSTENFQRVRNVDDDSFRDNLHDKDHGDWLIVSRRKRQSKPKTDRKSFGHDPRGYDNPFTTRGAFSHNQGKSGSYGHARDKQEVHQKRPHNEDPSSGHEGTNLIVKEGKKLSSDVDDTGLVEEASRSKFTAKNKAKGSNNIHRPGSIGFGMYSMMPVRMVSPNHLQFIEDYNAEPPDNNPIETNIDDCIVLSIHNEENMDLVPESQGTMMKEDEGQDTLMLLGSS